MLGVRKYIFSVNRRFWDYGRIGRKAPRSPDLEPPKTRGYLNLEVRTMGLLVPKGMAFFVR